MRLRGSDVFHPPPAVIRWRVPPARSAAAAARASGMGAAVDLSPGLMARLPLDFKNLGMSVHKRFDDLAQAARPAARSLAKLSRQHIHELTKRAHLFHLLHLVEPVFQRGLQLLPATI